MKKITNVAHDTKEVRSVMNGRKSILALFICLLTAHLFPLSVVAQEQEYNWGEITLKVGEQKTIYISDDYGYALDAPVYTNFWNSSDESCVRVVGSNQTKGYCVIEGLKATSNTKITCQLSFKFNKDDYQWRVYRGYYTVKVTEPPKPTSIFIGDGLPIKDKTCYIGAELGLPVTITPSGTNPKLIWSSDNPSIAKISKTYEYPYYYRCYVNAIKEGETYIRVKTDNGLEDSCKIKVKKDKITFKAKTIEGVDLVYLITSDEEKTCEVTYAYWLEEEYLRCGNNLDDYYFSYHRDTPPSVTIPSIVNGYTVTSIGDYSFNKSTTLYTVILPNTITKIGDYAFHDCGLESISLPNSIKSIGDYSFADIDEFSNLETVEIPEGMERIGHRAFKRMKELKSIILPNSIKYLGEDIAYGHKFESVISHIEYPNQVELFQNPSFPDWQTFSHSEKSDKGVTLYVPYGTKHRYEALPMWANNFDNIIEMDRVFHDGDTLTVKTVEGVDMLFRVICAEEKVCEVCGIDGKPSIDITTVGTVTIPSKAGEFTVTNISNGAFVGCNKVTAINIPESVTVISPYAFSGCTGLNSISVSDDNMFYDSRNGCNALIETETSTLLLGCANTVIPSSVTAIGESAFEGNKGLTSISIPNSVTSIGALAFANCNKLTSVSLPEGLTTIEEKTFADCNVLGTINIPASVTSIGKWAFLNCMALTSIMLPENLNSIGTSTFQGCRGLTAFVIPADVKSIGETILFSCYNLKEVISLIEKPFPVQDNTFSGIPQTVVLNVPRGTKADYEKTTGWANHFAKIEDGTPDYADGDVNMDGSVNGTDLVALANIILGKQAETESADVNQDGSVNGTDIVTLSNIILGRNNAKRRVATRESNSLSIEDFTIKAGEETDMLIDLNNASMDVTLVQFDLHLPKGLSIKKVGGDLDIDMADRTTWRKHTLDANSLDGFTRFLLYSSGNTLISGSEGAIIKVKLVADGTFDGGDITIDNALLVSPDQTEAKPDAYTYHVGGSVTPEPDDNKLAIEAFDIQAGEETDMLIDLDNPDDAFTLVQFDLHLPQGLSIKKVGGELDIDMADRTTWRKHTLDANTMGDFTRFLLYSGSNALISGNSGAIIKVKLIADDTYKGGDIVIDNALLVTPEQKESRPGAYVYTGIKGIMMMDDSTYPAIYNLSGQRLVSPSKGINIIKGKKVVVK